MTTRRMYLDRIEGEVAVLLPDDGENDAAAAAEEHVPRSALPPDAREGDWLLAATQHTLHITYICDESSTQAAKARVQSLMDELTQQE